MCEVVKVRRSSFCHWKKRKPTTRQAKRRAILSSEIFSTYYWSRGRYGTRIVRELESKGMIASLAFVAKLMKERLHYMKMFSRMY